MSYTVETTDKFIGYLQKAIDSDRFLIIVSYKNEDGSIEFKQIENGLNMIELNGVLEYAKQNNFLTDIKSNHNELLRGVND